MQSLPSPVACRIPPSSTTDKFCAWRPSPPEVSGQAPVGRLHVDGRLIVAAIDGPARMRRKLSFVGIVFVSLGLDDNGNIVSNPVVKADGLPAADEQGTPFEDFLLEVVDDALDFNAACPAQRRWRCRRGNPACRSPRRRHHVGQETRLSRGSAQDVELCADANLTPACYLSSLTALRAQQANSDQH